MPVMASRRLSILLSRSTAPDRPDQPQWDVKHIGLSDACRINESNAVLCPVCPSLQDLRHWLAVRSTGGFQDKRCRHILGSTYSLWSLASRVPTVGLWLGSGCVCFRVHMHGTQSEAGAIPASFYVPGTRMTWWKWNWADNKCERHAERVDADERLSLVVALPRPRHPVGLRG
jgi:hypothetical protein